MTSVRSNNISLKCQRFMTLCSKDIVIRKSEFDFYQFVKRYLRTISIYFEKLEKSFYLIYSVSNFSLTNNASNFLLSNLLLVQKGFDIFNETVSALALERKKVFIVSTNIPLKWGFLNPRHL